MTTPHACPQSALLARWLGGQLAQVEAERIETHVESCETCGTEIGTLRIEPAVTTEIRTGWRRLSQLEEDTTQLIAQLKSVPVGLWSGGKKVEMPQEMVGLSRVGPFEVDGRIGSGGMGHVFLATDTRLRRPVALKIIAPELLSARPAMRDCFLAEARAAAGLRHDHIVTIYEVGDSDGILYLAMELLQGETLQQRITREHTLPFVEILRVGMQICDALTMAHAAGIVHRDLKPGNVWLEPQADGFRVKLLDFGLAQQIESEEQTVQTQTLLGTPGYMAPEQARGDAVDGRADLFSLGCVLYRIATGELPFAGADILESMYALAVRQPVKLARLRPDLPAPFAQLVHAMLDKEPTRRPPAAADVALGLRQIEEASEQSDRLLTRASELPAAPTAATKTQLRASRSRWAFILIGSMVLATGSYFMPQVIQVLTNRGLLVITARDQDVEVSITGDDASPQIVVVDRNTSQRLVLEAGDYALNVRDQDGLELDTPHSITVRRGGRVVVRADLYRRGETSGRTAASDSQPAKSSAAPANEDRLPPITKMTDAHRIAGTPYLRHWNWLSALAISRDGKYIMTGSYDRTAVVWDTVERSAAVRISPQRTVLTSVAIAPGAANFAAGCADGQVKQWNRAGREVFSDRFSTPVRTVGYSARGHELAVMTDDTLVLYDTIAATELWRVSLSGSEDGVICGFAFSPDDRTIAMCDGEDVQLRDAQTGTEIGRYHVGPVALTCVAYSPNAELLALGLSTPDPSVVLFQLSKGVMEQQLKHTEDTDSALDVRFSRDGQKVLATFGRTLASGESDPLNTSCVRQWSVADGSPGAVIAPPAEWTGFVAACYGENDNHIYAAGRDLMCSVWDGTTGNRVLTPDAEDYIYSFGVSPNSGTLALAHYDGSVSFAHTDHAKTFRSLDAHDGVVLDVVWHPKEPRVVTSCTDGQIRSWDANNHSLLWSVPHYATGVGYHADGRVVVAGGRWFETPTVLIDAELGREIDADEAGIPVVSTAFASQSDRSLLVMASPERPLLFYDVPTPGIINQLTGVSGDAGETSPLGINALELSPAGALLAVAEGNSRVDRGQLKVWKLHEHKLIPHSPSYNRRVMSLAFVGRGRALATGGWQDSSVNLWDTESGKLLHSYNWSHGSGSVLRLELLGDGSLAALGADGCVYRLPLPSFLTVEVTP